MDDRAIQAALRLLARRDHFTGELREKLARKGFEAGEVEAAVAWCFERGYLDDQRLARHFAARRAEDRGWGPRRIAAELERRGVDRGVASRAARSAAVDPSAALATALRRAESRAPAGWWRLPARRARMVSSLLARGFEAADAIRAVEELAAARENHDHARDDQPGDPVQLS